MTVANDIPTLKLKKNEERRPLAGHLWIFSNEVDTKATPLTGFAPGQAARVVSSGGKPLGMALVNPASLICARIYARTDGTAFDRDFLTTRLHRALDLRQRLYAEPCYRAVFAEGDGLPGLVVDRFGGLLSVQISTAALEARRDMILEVLSEVFDPAGIILKNDASVRGMEGLPSYVEYVPARDPGPAPATGRVLENGCVYEFPALEGQKTGWFYDQRPNRAAAARYATSGSILDAFSYVGGFGIPAAKAGAERVVCLDASDTALEAVRANARANGVAERVSTRRGDAFSILREMRQDGERFDTVMLDPPALIKRRKDMREGFEAYRFLNHLGMSLVKPGGFLVTSSCSQHMEGPEFRRMLSLAAGSGHFLQILEAGRQGPDHPVHAAMPETEYLKCLICRVNPRA